MDNEITINPKILEWAREECGFSKPDMANKMHVGIEKYATWEENGTGISLEELKNVSKICKRQIAVFFWPTVPPKTKKPTDYRNLEAKQSRLTEKSLLSIRRTERYQEFLLQLHGKEYYQEKYKWIEEYKGKFRNFTSNIELIAQWVRNLLHYSIEEQINDTISIEDSYKKWRNRVEQYLGIHVFQFSMNETEIQGFSYSDSYPLCITVNNVYAPASRTFTLFHEIAHILKSESSLCKPHDAYTKESNEVEYYCNQFSGSLLVPTNNVISVYDKDTIFEYAKSFKVSSEVYLRRLLALKKVSETDFFVLLDKIRKSVQPVPPHYPKFPITKAINSRGAALFDSTINAMNSKEISYSLASDILGVKINYLFNV
jgi:Zn-dependent peptidase ImmA (M78 family)